MDIMIPIIGPITKVTGIMVEKKIQLLDCQNDHHLVGYIATHGGDANVTSEIIKKLSEVQTETIAYAGNIVYSSGAIIFSSFKERLAFEDSKFLIHESIPPSGIQRTKNNEDFDAQIWNFMAERLKISFVELKRIAKKGEKMSSSQALEIGLVDKIIMGSWRDHYKKILSIGTIKNGLYL